MTKSGGQFALASPTSNSGGGLVPPSPVIYAHGLVEWTSNFAGLWQGGIKLHETRDKTRWWYTCVSDVDTALNHFYSFFRLNDRWAIFSVVDAIPAQDRLVSATGTSTQDWLHDVYWLQHIIV